MRVISEAKGSAHFHNTALKLIVDYMKTIVPGLKRVFVFTDGCKGQYKGRHNFGRIAQFPSEHAGVHLHHRFSASHHFKGPHDGYGKDFKLLTRTAERNKKRRLPYTHDWYAFGASVMAQPMKKARTMRDVVDELIADPAAIAAAAAATSTTADATTANANATTSANANATTTTTTPTTPTDTTAATTTTATTATTTAAATTTTTASATATAARKRRAKRKRTIVAIDRGEEADGIRREENSRVEMRNEVDGIFSATKYHWLFFALPSPNVKVVPWGTVCKPDECHAVLDEREEGDADEVKGSTSLYEFAGINPRETEAELYLRCFPCQCMVCRNSSLSESFEACPNISQTGRWRRAACHRSHGAVKRAAKKRDDVEAFAKSIAAEKLYAAAGDPKNLERGGRPYWLLRTLGKARKISEKKGVRAWDSPKATTIKKGTWAVRAQWYVSTAIDPNQKRHGYKLLPGYVYVEVKTIIQEHGLEFQHEGRAGSGAECTMRDADHTRVMQHNFASYA